MKRSACFFAIILPLSLVIVTESNVSHGLASDISVRIFGKVIDVDGEPVSGLHDVLGPSQKAAKPASELYDIMVEKDGYEKYREEEFEVSGDVSEVRKDFVLIALIESYLIHFNTTHFFDKFYAVGDTVDIRLLSSTDLSENSTKTAHLPDSATVTVTTGLGDLESVKLKKGDGLRISYYDKCG